MKAENSTVFNKLNLKITKFGLKVNQLIFIAAITVLAFMLIIFKVYLLGFIILAVLAIIVKVAQKIAIENNKGCPNYFNTLINFFQKPKSFIDSNNFFKYL